MKQCAKIVVFIVLAAFCFACANNYISPIPDMPVVLDIVIMSDAPELNVIGGFKEFVEPKSAFQYLGYGGIVVFRSFDDNFVAFDMACPYEIKRDVRVAVDMSGVAVCSVCGSKFDVGYGTGMPSQGPAKYPLRRYKVYPYGTDKLRIYQ